MGNQDHYRKLETMYQAAPCNKQYDSKLTVEEGTAEVVIPVEKFDFHAGGTVHGATYFKSLDNAAYFAASSLETNVFLLTAYFNVHFIRSIDSGKIQSIGQVVDTTQSRTVAEAVAYDADERKIAYGTGSFVYSSIELSADLGYKKSCRS